MPKLDQASMPCSWKPLHRHRLITAEVAIASLSAALFSWQPWSITGRPGGGGHDAEAGPGARAAPLKQGSQGCCEGAVPRPLLQFCIR
jgi:hypothetical protein